MSTQLVAITAYEEDRWRQAATLVRSSLPSFYDLFAAAQVDVEAVIERSFRTRGSSVAGSIVGVDDDGGVVGLVSALETRDLPRANLVDLQLFLHDVGEPDRERVRSALRDHAQQVPPLERSGRYLSRFAVAEKERGSGLADRMIEHFESTGTEHSLHVHRDNARAIKFYQRHGYELVAGSTIFQIMTKRR